MLDALGPAVERRQQRRAASDYLGAAVAKELLGRRIPTGDDEPDRLAVDRIARGLDNRGEQRSLLFGTLALADVAHGGHNQALGTLIIGEGRGIERDRNLLGALGEQLHLDLS